MSYTHVTAVWLVSHAAVRREKPETKVFRKQEGNHLLVVLLYLL